MKQHSLFFVLMLSANLLSAANYTVVYYTGKNEIKKGTSPWSTAFTKGAMLAVTDSIKISDKSQIIFKDDAGKLYAATKQGSYSVQGIVKATGTQKAMTSELLRYVLHEVKGHHGSAEAIASREVQNIGGVSRGKVEPFLTSPKANSILLDNNIQFSWTGQKEGFVTFSIYRDLACRKQVYTKRLQDSVVNITATEVLLDTGRVYYWKVVSLQQQNTDVFPFEILSTSDAAAVQKELDAIKSTWDFSPGLNLALEAKFYEQKQLLLNAAICYKKAVAAEPENELLTKLMQEFNDTHQPK